MAGERGIPDFLSLPTRDYHSEDDLRNAIQPTLDNLFPGFPTRHRSVSPATLSSTSRRYRPASSRHQEVGKSTIDLRTLDYATEYDSHLMCPICHVPFIEPVVLDCDHTFCASCLEEYRTGVSSSERSQCPSCRNYILSSPRKASRLISNMCNDIKVHCPNDKCDTVLARGHIERHTLKDCLEQVLPCPGQNCEKQTKRKNYVPGQCIHETHIECDCGAVIELGRGEWLKHKDEDCPNIGVKCEHCGDRLTTGYLKNDLSHQCKNKLEVQQCPGQEFGCHDEVDVDDMEVHAMSCPLARLAPFLSRQNRLLNSMAEQLAKTKMRNETLEMGLDHVNDLLTTQIQPKISQLHISEPDDVEEIERDHIPGLVSYHHQQRDLLLPAHLRELTPSPTFSSSQAAHLQQNHFHSSPAARSTSSSTTTQQHLFALHDSLRNSITALETDMHQFNVNLAELDARSSMQIMNETLRLKEELAHINAALFSTRAQVQWLLNRERMGMNNMAHPNMMMMRGRQPSTDQTNSNPNIHQRPTTPSDAPMTSALHQTPGSSSTQQDATNINGEDVGAQSSSSSNGAATTTTTTTTSPIFGAINSNSSRRPSIRRHSGGSQDRVKL